MILGEIFIYIAGILWGVELIPQIIRTYRTKSVGDLSPAFFSMCMVAYMLYAVGNYLLKNWAVLIAHIPSLICNVIIVVMIFKYGRKDSDA